MLYLDPNGMEVVGDSTKLANFSKLLNEWLRMHGIKDASLSVGSAIDEDGNTYFKLDLNGLGWSDLANGMQAVTDLNYTVGLSSDPQSANEVATNALIHLSEVIRSSTVIDVAKGYKTSDGVPIDDISKGANSQGIHVALMNNFSLGTAMHELVGHGHHWYNPGWENMVGAAFGEKTYNQNHYDNYGKHWSENTLGNGGGYMGGERSRWGFGPKVATFMIPPKLPPRQKMNYLLTAMHKIK